jgi:hypothetical protein
VSYFRVGLKHQIIRVALAAKKNHRRCLLELLCASLLFIHHLLFFTRCHQPNPPVGGSLLVPT